MSRQSLTTTITRRYPLRSACSLHCPLQRMGALLSSLLTGLCAVAFVASGERLRPHVRLTLAQRALQMSMNAFTSDKSSVLACYRPQCAKIRRLHVLA